MTQEYTISLGNAQPLLKPKNVLRNHAAGNGQPLAAVGLTKSYLSFFQSEQKGD